MPVLAVLAARAGRRRGLPRGRRREGRAAAEEQAKAGAAEGDSATSTAC
jgi:hypothetical protein